jgi:hypothetical protein
VSVQPIKGYLSSGEGTFKWIDGSTGWPSLIRCAVRVGSASCQWSFEGLHRNKASAPAQVNKARIGKPCLARVYQCEILLLGQPAEDRDVTRGFLNDRPNPA